jgi:hypothetical protein
VRCARTFCRRTGPTERTGGPCSPDGRWTVCTAPGPEKNISNEAPSRNMTFEAGDLCYLSYGEEH